MESFSPSEGQLASHEPLNWLSATAFEKPHSLRHGNHLILQVGNRGNQRSTSICLLNASFSLTPQATSITEMYPHS